MEGAAILNRNRRLRLCLALAVGFCLAVFQARALAGVDVVNSVRLHDAPHRTRIVFDLPGPIEHRLDKLTDPDRIVLDLENTRLDYDIHSLDFDGTPIKDVRVGKHENHRTRVVFDLTHEVRMRTDLVKPVDPHGWRLVLDLIDGKTEPVKSVKSMDETGGSGPRPMIVAIDAGHGGEDPGAHGPDGTKEKNITLHIAKRLYRLMEHTPGLKPGLVRKGDYYIPLAKRRVIARKMHADVFISIHADAYTDPSATGASVFAVSRSGATTARARYLAQMANASDKVAGVADDEQDDSSLLSVLADMTTTGSMTHSIYMGRRILQQLDQVTDLHGDRHKVEQAGFAVLKNPDMVSVLVETGFISNRHEEHELRSGRHQERIARAILRGVESYFEHHPPPGSLFAAERNGDTDKYRIKPGDTLSSIAQQYSVSMSAIRSANDLDSDMIQVGQVLQIP